jgi:hypothetical protein
LVFEDGLEIVNVAEVLDGIGGLGAHPFVFYQQIDDFAEVACRFDVPVIEHEHCESAPFFNR